VVVAETGMGRMVNLVVLVVLEVVMLPVLLLVEELDPVTHIQDLDF
jgi:hypothetical protein|tara:strand:- start:427 stop:564 length:138 start_codon:yes stop_codon:yes gene_type:complete